MDVRVGASEFGNGGKLGGVTDVGLGDGITQTGRAMRWLSSILCLVTTSVTKEKKVQGIIKNGQGIVY